MCRYLCLKMSSNEPARLFMEYFPVYGILPRLPLKLTLSCSLASFISLTAFSHDVMFQNNKIYLLAKEKWVIYLDKKYSDWMGAQKSLCLHDKSSPWVSCNKPHLTTVLNIELFQSSAKHVLPWWHTRSGVDQSLVTQSLVFEARAKGTKIKVQLATEGPL